MKRQLLSHRMSQLLRQLPVVVLLLSLAAAAGYAWTRPALATSHIFANSGQILGGETGNGVALGDLDGDGDLDAFVANDHTTFGEANQVWFNAGDGTFTAGQTMGSANGHDVALGDLDGDGDLDALVVGIPPTSLLTARVWLNVGGAQGGVEGTFDGGSTFGSSTAYGVALGDVDGDGDLDALLVGNSNQVWLNNGNSTFSAGPALPFLFSEDAVLADLDDDGWLDALIVDSASGTSSHVWWNDGNWSPGPGSFTAGDPLPAASLVHGAAVGNLDGDNRPDIFLAGSGADQIYWNDGGRDFSAGGALPANDSSWDVALGDVDGDADLDAVVANITAEPNRVWRNDGGRAFTVDQEFGDEIGLYWSRALGLGDLNGDGALDLFEVTTAEDRVWLNEGVDVVVPNEPGWQVQLVDARGDAGYSPSLALDANGYPHISYGRLHQGQDDTYSYLTYARWDGVRWHDEFVANGVSDTALALDAAGRAQIAFTNGRANILQLARWDGTAWQIETVDSAPFPQTMALGGLALDGSGRAHIVYNTYSNTSGEPELLKLARWDGAAWQIQTVESKLIYDSALALDGAGDVHLSYAVREEFDTHVLKYALWNGASWQTEVLDGDVPDAGVFVTALALDGSGNPTIAYALDTFQGFDQLKVASLNGTSWQIETVSTLDADEEIADVGLDIDATGDPHLVTFRSNPNGRTHQIEYIYREGTSWEVETLDGGEGTSLFRDRLVGMALDAAGLL
ncbi:MAG: VCBS repeat-containing protein, partial [Chloroflexi bacterium]|nr:VCBS repeat-containing protein [Chloroflexota bacterium]